MIRQVRVAMLVKVFRDVISFLHPVIYCSSAILANCIRCCLTDWVSSDTFARLVQGLE